MEFSPPPNPSSGLFMYTHLKTNDDSDASSSKNVSFARPYDLCFDNGENLWMTSETSSIVRCMNRLGVVSNVTEPMSRNSDVGLRGICVGFNGNIFVTASDHCVRMIDKSTHQHSLFA